MTKTDPSHVRVTGPLAPYVDGFCAQLADLGYTPLSAAERLDVGQLTPERVEAFLRARRAQGYTCWLSQRGLGPLLGYLRRVGVAPQPLAPAAHGPVEALLAAYRGYLVGERGLAAASARRYEDVARLLLSERSGQDGENVGDLSAGDVVEFVLRECRRRSVGSAKYVVTALRSLLRFLHVEGWTAAQLAPVVPAVAGRRGGSLPKALDPGQVARLLAGCDRDAGVGLRDYAILVLLTRLGLRAGEVAALRLADVDWRAGEIEVTGKGRVERLPLPADVGAALAAYLRDGRPRAGCRALLLRARAPYAGISADGVKGVVRSACDRAGLPRVGAHRLRHTAATEMLRAGAGLGEVAQVLRHRSLSTTAIYAKVDLAALRPLALPWPGSAA